MSKMPSMVLLAATITLLTASAYAEVVGTYKGGFESRRKGLSIELRCDGSGLCEDDVTETNDGEAVSEPSQKWELKPLGGCATPPKSEWDECEGRAWEAVRTAIDFARKNIDEQEYPELKGQLRPFLTSRIDTGQCYSMPGSAALCDLEKSPWGKPVLLYMPMMLTPCYPPSGFCTYRIIPLFKTSNDGALRSKWGGSRSTSSRMWNEQTKVAPYIRQLEDLVRAAVVVAPGTPDTARVTIRADFDGDTGRLYSATALGAYTNTGCSCPTFRTAVLDAAHRVKTFPLLPIEQRGAVGGGRGRVILEITAGPRKEK